MTASRPSCARCMRPSSRAVSRWADADRGTPDTNGLGTLSIRLLTSPWALSTAKPGQKKPARGAGHPLATGLGI